MKKTIEGPCSAPGDHVLVDGPDEIAGSVQTRKSRRVAGFFVDLFGRGDRI